MSRQLALALLVVSSLIPAIVAAGNAAPAKHRVYVTLRQPNVEATTCAVTVDEGTKTSIRFKQSLRGHDGNGTISFDQAALFVPGEDDRETVSIGHAIQLKATSAEGGQLRLDVDWQYRKPSAIGAGKLRVTGQTLREVVTVSEPGFATMVLETDAEKAPRTWIEIVVESEDQKIAVNTREQQPPIYTVTYSVFDLVRPVLKNGQTTVDFDPLVELICTTVQPESWQENGGPAAVAVFRNNLSLVISQTEGGHDQVRRLLTQLRRLNGTAND